MLASPSGEDGPSKDDPLGALFSARQKLSDALRDWSDSDGRKRTACLAMGWDATDRTKGGLDEMAAKMTRRVVVTGLGIVAPTGNCVREAWESALNCRSAVARIRSFDASGLAVQIAAEVKDFDCIGLLGEKLARQSSRFVQFSAAAVREALDDCGLDPSDEADRCGCIIGVGLGASGTMEHEAYVLRDRGARRVSPLMLPYAIPNMAAAFAAIRHGLRGPSFCVATACASGTHAIGEALLHIAAGTADMIVAGGAESATSPLMVASFARMGAPEHQERHTGAGLPAV
jgi:3-oxoacyl-[acyl-carrier-protein] synthase II